MRLWHTLRARVTRALPVEVFARKLRPLRHDGILAQAVLVGLHVSQAVLNHPTAFFHIGNVDVLTRFAITRGHALAYYAMDIGLFHVDVRPHAGCRYRLFTALASSPAAEHLAPTNLVDEFCVGVEVRLKLFFLLN